MAGLTLGGLASGMDTNTIITQLMLIEGQSKLRLQGRQYAAQQTKTALDQMGTRLRGLQSAADDLKSAGAWGNVQTVNSSDPARVGARFLSGAAVGSFSIEVTKLARADQRFYTQAAPPGAATEIDINGVKIQIAAGSTLEQTAAAINGKADSPAFASVVGTELVLSGKQTNVALTVTDTFLTEDLAKRRAPSPAEFRIDGEPAPPALPYTSNSNTVTNALPGVELTLKSLTTGPVAIEVGPPGPDQAALKTKVKAFVDAYNSAIDLIKTKTEEQAVKTPTLQSDYGKGVLRGDIALLSVQSQMRQFVSSVIPADPASTAYDRLADIGISVPSSSGSKEDRLAGKLVIDDAKLTAAIQADPTAVRRLFGGVTGVDGLAQGLTKILEPVADLTGGSLSQRATQSTRESSRIADQLTAMDARLKVKEERLRRQFTAMETALAASQNQTSWLSGQIAGLTTSS
jgi:flagellar hook-associated protein 2